MILRLRDGATGLLQGEYRRQPCPSDGRDSIAELREPSIQTKHRPSVTGTLLRFAMTSPPSGCQRGTLTLARAVEHARHTIKKAALAGRPDKRNRLSHLTQPGFLPVRDPRSTHPCTADGPHPHTRPARRASAPVSALPQCPRPRFWSGDRTPCRYRRERGGP